MARIDFEVSGGGTVYLLTPLTPAARAWAEEHLSDDATWWCGAIAVGAPLHRPDRRGAIGDGLVVR